MSQSMYQSGEYLENNPGWHSADAPFKAGWIEAILARNAIRPGKLVEVGCGAGQILVELARRYPETRFEGYDISPQAMEIARPKAREGLSYHHADFLTLEPSEDVDVAMAIDVFEHVDDYRGFLRALRTRATWKLFHIPLDLSVQAVLRSKGIMYAHSRLGHIHYFYKDSALSALRDCGYEVVDWNYTHAAEVMPNRALKTRLANIPRKLLRVFGEDFSVRVTGGSSMMVLAR
jgi:cyclopropane fatty-acyl-phospholipid synthase-like methyltransferase